MEAQRAPIEHEYTSFVMYNIITLKYNIKNTER